VAAERAIGFSILWIDSERFVDVDGILKTLPRLCASLESTPIEKSEKTMDLNIGTAIKLARHFFGRLAGAKADSGESLQVTTSTSEIPKTIELIPGKLKVRIFHHEIKYEDERIPCWSFVTDGMMAHKQKEMILTLRREPNQNLEDYPRQLVDLLATIFDLAKKGQVVDVGQSTLFDEAGVPGYKDVRGIGYVEAHGFPGVETREGPLLAAILLKGDEGPIAWEFGLTRITAMLGKMYHYYPYPTWSDLKREPVGSRGAMGESFLGKITRVYARASYYEEQKHIFLSVQPSSRAQLRKILEELPPTTPLALSTQPDPRANACLVWRPGADQPMAIMRQGSNGSRKTGAFLAFLPEQGAIDVRMVEDGYALFLKNRDWENIREALLSGTDFVTPEAELPGTGISLKWSKPLTYTSPVTGDSYTAEGWTTYEPQAKTPPKELAAVSSSRIVLLTGQQDLQAYTTAEDLVAHTNNVEKAVDTFFTHLEPRTNREITIQLELTSKGSAVRFVAVPALDTKAAGELRDRLRCVPAPKVGGPVKFDLILKIWGIASKQ
jgi:hypothetical protein